MNSDEFDREFNLDDPKLQEVLHRLGSDYDENGIPYWENNERAEA
jgi:hypothetical protein